MNLETAIEICRSGNEVSMWRNAAGSVVGFQGKVLEVSVNNDSEVVKILNERGRELWVCVKDLHQRESDALKQLCDSINSKFLSAHTAYLNAIRNEQNGGGK